MAVNYQNKIVTNGLVLCLDAADKKSYPGSGTVWTDRSGRGNNGTLTNGPTFSGINGGSIVFDGVNDYVSLPSGLIESSSFTFSCFLKYSIPGLDTFRDIINNRSLSTALSGVLLSTDFSAKNGLIRVQLNNSTTTNSFTSTGTKNIANNEWNNIVIVVNRSNNLMTFFINSIQEGNTFNISTIGDITPASNLTIGGDLAFNDVKAWFPGNIPQVLIYNRALAATEITQNFNATRGRFAI